MVPKGFQFTIPWGLIGTPLKVLVGVIFFELFLFGDFMRILPWDSSPSTYTSWENLRIFVVFSKHQTCKFKETNNDFTPENQWLGDEFPFGVTSFFQPPNKQI